MQKTFKTIVIITIMIATMALTGCGQGATNPPAQRLYSTTDEIAPKTEAYIFPAFRDMAEREKYNVFFTGSMKADLDGRTRRVDDPTVPDIGKTAPYSPAIDLGAHELRQWSPADFNFDHHVNGADWDHFVQCALGPGIAQDDPACFDADLSLNQNVDAADFGLFQRCLSGDVLTADPFCLGDRALPVSSKVSACLSSSLTLDDYPYCGDPWMEYTVSGPGELTVTRHGAVHNCCPDLIEAVVTQGRGLLHFEEQETTTNPCTCLCCYDVQSKVTGLSGTYDIEYCWVFPSWDKPRTCVTATITVP
jgi:hypothetical protein